MRTHSTSMRTCTVRSPPVLFIIVPTRRPVCCRPTTWAAAVVVLGVVSLVWVVHCVREKEREKEKENKGRAKGQAGKCIDLYAVAVMLVVVWYTWQCVVVSVVK